MWKVLGNILCNNNPKVKVKSENAVCLMVHHRLHSSQMYIHYHNDSVCVKDVMTDETADSDAHAHQEIHCLSIRPRSRSKVR